MTQVLAAAFSSALGSRTIRVVQRPGVDQGLNVQVDEAAPEDAKNDDDGGLVLNVFSVVREIVVKKTVNSTVPAQPDQSLPWAMVVGHSDDVRTIHIITSLYIVVIRVRSRLSSSHWAPGRTFPCA